MAEEHVKQLEQSTLAAYVDKQAAAAGTCAGTSTSAGTSVPGNPVPAAEGDIRMDPLNADAAMREIVPSGLSQASGGGSREAAMMRNVLLRFDHHSFELGLGPQQIKQALEVLSRDVEELADLVISNVKPPEASSSSISEDYEMPSGSEDDPSNQTPFSTDTNYLRRLDVSSQIMQFVFNDFMVRPLAVLGHSLCAVEPASQPADNSEASLLASLLRGDACREGYAVLCKAKDGKSKRCNNIIRARSIELGNKISAFYHCPATQPDKVVFGALLVGCMVPAAHPSLRLFCTAASPELGPLQPFCSAAHTPVLEVPGLEWSNPAARAVLRTLLPGVGFQGEVERIICERVVTKAKDPCHASASV